MNDCVIYVKCERVPLPTTAPASQPDDQNK